MIKSSCQINSTLDTWVDPRSKIDGWKVKVLDVYPDDYAGSTTAKVELFDPEGNSQGEEIIYIHRQDVKIGETYDARIDGLMAMPRIIGVPNISYDEVPSMKNVTRERYLKSSKSQDDFEAIIDDYMDKWLETKDEVTNEEIEWAEKNLKGDEYDKWYQGELDIRDRIHSSKQIKSSVVTSDKQNKFNQEFNSWIIHFQMNDNNLPEFSKGNRWWNKYENTAWMGKLQVEFDCYPISCREIAAFYQALKSIGEIDEQGQPLNSSRQIKSSISEYRVGNKVILKAEGDSATRTVIEVIDPKCQLRVGDSVNDFSSNKDYLDNIYDGNFVITSSRQIKSSKSAISVPDEIQNEYFEIEGRINRAWNSGKLPFCDYDYLKAELDKAVTKYKFFSRYNNLYHVLEGRNDFWDRLNSFESIKSSPDYHDYDYEYQDKHEEDIDNWLYQINGKMCKPDPLIINDLNHWLDGNKEFFRGFEVNNPWRCVDISKCDDEIKEIFKNCTEGYCLSLLNCDLPYYENEVYLPNSNCYGTMKLIFPDEDNENQKVLWFIPNKLSEQTSSIVDNRHDNQKSITEGFIQSAVNEINSEDPVEVLLKDAAVHFGATYKEDWYGKGIQEGDGNWSGGRWAVLVDESQDIPEIHFIAAKGSTGVVPMNGKTAEGEQFPEDLIYWIENKIRESDEDDGSFEDQVDKFRNIDLNGIDYMDSNSSSRTVYIKTSTKSDSVAEDMAEKIAEITGNENYMIYDFYETSEDSYDNLDFDTRDEKVIIFSL